LVNEAVYAMDKPYSENQWQFMIFQPYFPSLWKGNTDEAYRKGVLVYPQNP
jgi:hypothetical protein